MRDRIAIGLLCWMLACAAAAQISVVSATLNAAQLTRSAFLTIQVSNTGAAAQVVLNGSIRSYRHGNILQFRTAVFRVDPGGAHFTASELPIEQFEFASSMSGRSASVDKRLMAGGYEYCITITDRANGEEYDTFCDELEQEDQLVMDLVSPFDGDTIDAVRPTLYWMITGQGVPFDQRVELTLSPLDQHHDPYRSITAALPHYVAADVRTTAFPYPMGVQDLERGKCYVWQVQRFLDKASIDRSEAWRFCVAERPAPRADKYVLLGDGRNDGSYDGSDGLVFFRWDAAYNDAAPKCTLFDAAGTEITDAATKENVIATVTSPGLYVVDLRPLELKHGRYRLVVEDMKGLRDELIVVVLDN